MSEIIEYPVDANLKKQKQTICSLFHIFLCTSLSTDNATVVIACRNVVKYIYMYPTICMSGKKLVFIFEPVSFEQGNPAEAQFITCTPDDRSHRARLDGPESSFSKFIQLGVSVNGFEMNSLACTKLADFFVKMKTCNVSDRLGEV